MLKHFLILFILLVAANHSNANIYNKLKVGDVILLPLNCYVCSLIEDETNSDYSHSAVVIKKDNNNIYVAQALGNVHMLTLDKFLKMQDTSRRAKVMRPYQFNEDPLNPSLFYTYYVSYFHNKPFDHDYLWNNFTKEGDEKLYCAEFIAKLLNHFLSPKLSPTPMEYSRNYNYWRQYFGHEPPQGKPGVSPSNFESSPLFYTIGFIN
jgi:hypothetical protein